MKTYSLAIAVTCALLVGPAGVRAHQRGAAQPPAPALLLTMTLRNEARRILIIQREAIGLRNHRLVDQQFPEPPRLDG